MRKTLSAVGVIPLEVALAVLAQDVAVGVVGVSVAASVPIVTLWPDGCCRRQRKVAVKLLLFCAVCWIWSDVADRVVA